MFISIDPHNTKRIAIISPERARRPDMYREGEAGLCPFCPGNEYLTPPPTLVQVVEGSEPRYVSPLSASTTLWNARCFPNKFPALSLDPSTKPRVPDTPSVYGYHEVLVETRLHSESEYLANSLNLYYALHALRERARQIMSDSYIVFFTAVKNYGLGSGGSIPHPHLQLFGLTYVPPEIADEVETSRAAPICPLCNLDIYRDYVVYENEGFTLSLAPAPRAPYEMILIPQRHRSSFTEVSDGELMFLADALRVALLFIEKVLGEDYNYWLHTAPKGVDRYHWHIEIMPRTENWGGFERGARTYIVPVDMGELVVEVRNSINSLLQNRYP